LFYNFQSGGNVLLEAMQILESMQEKNKVLGGMLLHQNKYVITDLSFQNFNLSNFILISRIVVSQFGFELTKLIQLTNPFCNKVSTYILSI